MSWLARIIAIPVINYLITKMIRAFRAQIYISNLEKENRELREKLENANTKEEREDAAVNIINRY